MLRKGDWVWVDSNIGVPIGASVKETSLGQRVLVDDDGKEHRLSREKEASLKIMHPTSVEGVDDMIKLGDMTEAGLLRNLLIRYKQDITYTYTGSVLVAVNPYKDHPIYSPEQVKLYHGRRLGELPPHIFAIAEACYFNMTRHLRDQCCIISGESGAGKTESTKLILQYLAAISGELSEQQIEKQILESNPILEAFGNAKTTRNDNSSRFGKYLEIFFNKDGVIVGARVEQYLLEKSRVCHQAPEERNYHIFYCMLKGMSAQERKTLRLGNAKEYAFLTKGDCTVCKGRNDASDYIRVHSAMRLLMFSEDQCQEIHKLLAAILHLGNLCFESSTENNVEKSDVRKSEHFGIAASLLEVNESSLASSLTKRSLMITRESVTKPLSSEQASDCRDALVKAIYNKLFIWITGKINSVIYKKVDDNPNASYLSIGLLDIFGFENFQTNSFEQLCINFANEKLQQFFVDHIFKIEQEEYLKDDIVWNNITYTDNQNVLDLLAGKPCNLLALIDEESHFPKGSDLTLLNKMNQQHKKNSVYIASRSNRDTGFGICHFAGVVHYESIGFLEKNRDAVSSDIIKMVDNSTNELLRQIFEKELTNNEAKNSKNSKVTITYRTFQRGQFDNHKQVPTLTGQFRQSLDSLMKALSICQPFFIRCFKPNTGKKSKVFDREVCMRQLRYSGMMDTIRIRKLGYPIRHTVTEFLARYRVLLKTPVCDPKTASAMACCQAICKAVIGQKDEWKIGRNKIFLKDAHDALLERRREQEFSRVAMVIQGAMRGYRVRKAFLRKRWAAMVLQRYWRAFREGKIQRGFQRLASKIRSRKLQSMYQRQRSAVLTIQAQVRGHSVRKDWRKMRAAAIVIQAHVRGFQARKATEKMKNDMGDQDGWKIKQELDNLVEEQLLEVQRRQSAKIQRNRKSATSTPAPSLDGDDDDMFDDDSDEYSFYKFSVLHFENKATHTHVSHRLKKPLLHHDDEGDVLACLTVSWIILRFMEDMLEPKPLDPSSPGINNISRNLPSRQGRRLSNLVGLDQKILRRSKNMLGGGIRKASSTDEELMEISEEDVLIGEGPTLDRPLSPLEKLHVIVGYALWRPDIRDEVYCQICKQLVNNNRIKSRKLGWILLSICLGAFPPTDLFLKYLESFVRRAPSTYREYCMKRLRRIVATGERKEPPCWVELEAAKSTKPIVVSVALPDGHAVSLHLESASTSAEVCQAVADRIGLKDTYGFSLYISLYDKTWSLGSCGNHVFDAVSQCEQEMRSQGAEEGHAPWRLSLRKELFTPWHDCFLDPVSTDLIYMQVIKGIKYGEYTSDKEDEYVQLAAKHYYIQFGLAYNRDNVRKVVEECITTELIENKSMSKWIQLISTEHLQSHYAKGMYTTDRVKGELVDSAREKWPVHFSKFYEVTVISGPLPKGRYIVAVNWSGIFFMEGRDKSLAQISYIEVKKVQMMSDGHLGAQFISLSTVRWDFVLRCVQALDMNALIEENVEGLRQRSVYAIVQRDTTKPYDPALLVCKRGDLLLVEKNKESLTYDGLFRATNQRTGISGVVNKDSVQLLPTLHRPSDKMLELLSLSQKRPPVTKITTQGEDVVASASLKDFALENFRPAGKDAGRHSASKGVSQEKLWAYTREPLKQPLMMYLAHNADLSNVACNVFTAILKYMGDYPIKQDRSVMELTDEIFGQATHHIELHDEIYCQIMRQMTNNNSRLSMERGWQLLWLCSGLFPPGPKLMKHAKRFLETRPRDPLSAGCLQRLEEISRKKSRKLPPHVAEVDAIQQNSTKIFHKVHFPDETSDLFEVTSTTTVKELCVSIASQLKLSSADGFGLYVKTASKTTSLVDRKYFFDSLRHATDPRKSKRMKEVYQANTPCLVIFKRKLWFNVTPGKDLIADVKFHFPQEMPKYLRGYHRCSREDMFDLGGLLFRVRVDSDRSQFVMIPRMLKELVPADKLKITSSENWKKQIISSYNKQSGITVQEAKVAFLKTISSWPTFGCSFFEVKQTSDSTYPSSLLIAINKLGINLIDPKDMEPLVLYPFSRIAEYHSRSSYFMMTVGTVSRGNNFVFETTQGHTIEDLLKSYVSMYEEQRQAYRSKNQTFF
ncbi:unconventional myosin-VIIa-like isoform X2 [Mugil cephalus]|uniref:unconventional myosin-VIIa-like isoform X2 n=1 Tax=Mugil cephalus TaxID=48193 RepID=UPI001FB7C976|nr:unconventional myosin-VIIa-like isoform X2 [Mugil cephalus]